MDASSGGNSGSGGTGGTGGSGNTGSTTPPATINPNYQATYMGGLVNYNNGALTAGGMTIAGTPNADGTYTYDAASLGYVAMSTNTSGDLVLTSDLGNGSLQNAHYYQNSDGGYTADTINVPNVGSINTILPNYGSTQPSYMSDPANQQIFANYSAAITGLVDGSNGVGSDPNYLNTYNQALSAYKNMLNQVKSSGTTLNPADSLLLSQPSN